MSQFYQQLATLSPEQRALFEQKLAEKGLKSPSLSTIAARPNGQNTAPLSFAQQRLWFVQQLEPNNAAYNVASVLRLQGDLNLSALEQSLNALVARHEVFRTHFDTTTDSAGKTQPLQVINPPKSIKLSVQDLREEDNSQEIAEQTIESLTQTPFDLSQPLLRTALLQTADNSYLLVLTTHHIISDRWSVMVFLREMTILYRAFSQGQKSPLSSLPVQYADWAIWQRQQLQGEKLQRQIKYWTNQLSGELPVLELPFDQSYGAIATYKGSQVPLSLSVALTTRLKTLSNQYQVTLFTLLLTAFKVLLHRYTGSNDIVIGSDIANRDRTETEGLIGLLVNTLVFRSDLSDNPRFCDLLRQIRETVLTGLAHKDLPFEKLVEVINPERHLSQMMPLFQVKLDLQQVDVKPMQLDGLTISRYPLPETQAKYELRFNLQDTPQGIAGQIEYNSDLFDEHTIVRMVEHFQTLLTGLVENPERRLSELPILSDAERQMILTDWNRTQRDYQRNRCIHHLFEAQVERTPDAIALIDAISEEHQLTYAELNAQANKIAYHLRNLGVAPGHLVGVCLPRSHKMIAGMLAILKVGAAYVPLDPAYPTERLAFIAEDAKLSVMLATNNTVDVDQSLSIVDIDTVLQGGDDSNNFTNNNLDSLSTPNDLAYVIYTSGSTGKPKGVAIEHRSTVTLLHWAKEQYSRAELSGVLAATSICFDLSIFEIFVPLGWGGTAIVVENALSLTKLPSTIGVSLINTVPSLLNQLLSISTLPPSVQTVNLAGEALPPSLVNQLQTLSHIQKIYNLYGPSEDTTYSTCAPLHNAALSNSRVPIGTPIANTQAYVLDHYQNPVPIGVSGELYLGGDGLARGYLNRPDFTVERFQTIPSLPSSPILYKTGDRVRYLPNGSLEFLGRFDHQVKIRGFRIEVGEVETAIRENKAVKEAVIIAHGNTDKRLVAYIVPKETLTNSDLTETLRRDLSQRLPAYLVPTLWVELDELPQLPNGKIDRKSLPQPTVQAKADYVFPRSETEQTLVSIWCDVLNREKIGIYDNFFELGGHSLLAIEIVARAEDAFERSLPLKAIFQSPTIAGLATHLEADAPATSASERPQITVNPTQRHQPFPLTDIQRAYWIGRTQAFELGNIGTHGYREIEVKELSVEQIEQALNALIVRHDMLRAVVNPDGQQQILPTVPHYSIKVTDLQKFSDNDQPSLELEHSELERREADLREKLSHQVFTPQQWPLFHIEAALLPNNKVRFFVSFDVLIGDAWSFQILGKEMAQLISGQQLSPLTLSFRDYVMAEQAFYATDAYSNSLTYWRERLAELPPAPELPLTMTPSQVSNPRFERRSGRLEASKWANIKQRANKAGLTPSGVILSAFAEVLATWSKYKRFTLNLTLFNRLPLHPEVNQIVGDFTASLLLAVDNTGQEAFSVRAQRLQSQLWEDLEHRAVSGVRVLRELANLQNRGTAALMPVVFTSTLNQSIPSARRQAWKTETVFSVSQTSQVYLDHQVSEIDGVLVFNWDAIADLFPPDVLDQMFTAYSQLLHQLAENEAAWQAYPQLAPTDYVRSLNQTQQSFTQADSLLHELFFYQAKQQPEHPAIITPAQTLTYEELAARSHALSCKLQKLDIQPNQLIAVSMEKGWQQVVAVLGILCAGAAYVPIDPALPQERRWQLIAETKIEIVLQASGQTIDWPTGLIQICIDEQFPEINIDHVIERKQKSTDLAYVIYTSGSTGTPKGVMIDHQGAVNTLLDINQRFEVTNRDRIFALSSLSFDLSVYDIFGTLAAGATIVMPAAQKAQNPTHWRSLLTQHQVTVWNSVPALMHLLTNELEAANAESDSLPADLRLVLLSGDWIPLTLPQQIQRYFPQSQIISLGGATEASIWSVFYPIKSVDPTWHSIPYGRPLTNQQWYVLDKNLQPCPPWVPGDLYISGIGLAKGYWNKPDLTAERFICPPFDYAQVKPSPIPYPPSLTLLYKTGDLGRYLPTGNLEFLGREDFQVKINGYRIELGEIESALQQYPAIESAVVEAVGVPTELVAYIVPKLRASQALNQPLSKLDFKQQQLGLRKNQEEDEIVNLPAVQTTTERLIRRQSHRQYLEEAIDLSTFSELLSKLSSQSLPNAPLPKYHYASAGSLYPIQTYLHIQKNRILGLDSGWYYYHPADHRLVKIAVTTSSSETDFSELYGPNSSIHQASAFSLFLIANMSAIEPIYGEKARDFCLIETGYMGQLLMEQAPELNLGLCPIGGFQANTLQQILSLSSQHIPLHALVGGAIDPSWNQQWQAIAPQPQSQSITDTLKQHLSSKLPSYMVPARYQILETLPLTANGKVDRRALPAPNLDSTTTYVAPTNSTEETITHLWETLLETHPIGIYDNFFEVGGNSLIAIQLLSQLQNTFAVELTIAQLFGALTPAKQAEMVSQTSNDGETNLKEQQLGEEDSNTVDVNALSEEEVDNLLSQLLAEKSTHSNSVNSQEVTS
ncbi:MAG: amino acid adenylation domain-containing protein [Cyanobacteria bacterium J06623_4]